MDSYKDERFRWKDKSYELKVANNEQGYSVTVYEEGNPRALRIYTVGYLTDMQYQSVYGKAGVQALKDLAKHDIQQGWLPSN